MQTNKTIEIEHTIEQSPQGLYMFINDGKAHKDYFFSNDKLYVGWDFRKVQDESYQKLTKRTNFGRFQN